MGSGIKKTHYPLVTRNNATSPMSAPWRHPTTCDERPVEATRTQERRWRPPPLPRSSGPCQPATGRKTWKSPATDISFYPSRDSGHPWGVLKWRALPQTGKRPSAVLDTPRPRAAVRQVLPSCTLCKRYDGRPFSLLPMPPMPPQRILQSDPFRFAGSDYLGWLLIRKDRTSPPVKMWVALFTCLVFRAIHLLPLTKKKTAT